MNVFRFKIGASILRIFVGLFLLKEFLIYYNNKDFLFPSSGIISYNMYRDMLHTYGINGLYIDFNNPLYVSLFCWAGILLSFLFLLGTLRIPVCIGLVFLLIIFKCRNLFLLDGGDNVLLVILPFLGLTPSYSLITLKISFWNKIIPFEKRTILQNVLGQWSSWVIRMQILIVYLIASLHKLSSPVWKSGMAVYNILNSEDYNGSILNTYLTQNIFLSKLLTWGTILFQISFVFLIWFCRTKYMVLSLGVLFHIGIFITMRIDNFSMIIVFSYMIFIEDSEYSRFQNYILNKYRKIKLKCHLIK